MDELQIFNMEQGTPEWFEARKGIPTASEFKLLAREGKKKGTPSLTRQKYLRRLAAEVYTGQPQLTGWDGNEHSERGKIMEEEARKFYSIFQTEPLTQVGFCRRGRMGASPDSLVGSDGALEIKTKLPHLLTELIEEDVFPAEHYDQCQGVLLVTGRQWIDLLVYWPGMPRFLKRVERDVEYLGNLRQEIARFNEELDKTVELLRNYRGV